MSKQVADRRNSEQYANHERHHQEERDDLKPILKQLTKNRDQGTNDNGCKERVSSQAQAHELTDDDIA